jgi:hypothetical protein
MVFALPDEFHRNPDSRHDHRRYGRSLVAQTMNWRKVAEILGHAPRTVATHAFAYPLPGLSGQA